LAATYSDPMNCVLTSVKETVDGEYVPIWIFKEYLKSLNRLCDITWFWSVYA
jgi:small nuclear ribonucleoprotein (snRNP)-like protein